jgi:hypothetical protein
VELGDGSKPIIESDSFYYAAPLPEMKAQFDAIWKLDNFLTTSNDPEIQTVDFDCVVTVNPTAEQLEELRKVEKEHFDETVRISTKHTEATRCVLNQEE